MNMVEDEWKHFAFKLNKLEADLALEAIIVSERNQAESRFCICSVKKCHKKFRFLVDFLEEGGISEKIKVFPNRR